MDEGQKTVISRHIYEGTEQIQSKTNKLPSIIMSSLTFHGIPN
jgi:hypothetical protein